MISTGGSLHALAWVLWLVAVMIAVSITRNPLYLGLTLLWVMVIHLVLHLTAGPIAPPITTVMPLRPFAPFRFALIVVTLATLVNGLNVHIGSTVLFSLPRALPLIGGAVTLEACVYGALSGFVLSTLFAAFALVGRVLSVRALIGLIPRAYYPVAVVVTIALTFVPLTLRQMQAIREAQAIRGHRVRGVRDWLPLFLPLLLSGLERALQLAEAMTARGFAGASHQTHGTRTRLSLIAGLGAVLAGLWLQLSGQWPLWGMIVALNGTALVLTTLWLVGRRQQRTTYRTQAFQRRDWVVVGGALWTMALLLLPLPGIDRSSLYYYPYPTLTLPTFNFFFAIATWGLLTPALVQRPGSTVLSRDYGPRT